MIGQTVSHYRILDKLGEGGMGVVYRAQDTKLDRVVALKFLPQALTADPEERERFYQEARAASQLLHPNVTAIFEINEADRQIYLAMEYVGGTTLKKRIQDESTLAVGKALDMAIQLCTGIAAAHEKGIVHRDIKSENILVTSRGELKITDFGLAKLKGATKLTKTGSTLGTAAYMSPEQARGEDVDARSDIFSCGVVLYELFSGKLPFRGDHQAAILYALVNEEPPPLARFNEHVSPELQRIVSKALAKDKEDRYQHADEMLADLKRERKAMEYARTGVILQQAPPPRVQEAPVQAESVPPAGSRMKLWLIAGAAVLIVAAGVWLYFSKRAGNDVLTSAGPGKIAVLPFENIGPADKDYFADGLTDEIRTKLSGLSNLLVIARASSMQYKKTSKSVPEIGNELKVGYLLQGTIRWEESGTGGGGTTHLLVNPTLVKIADQTQVWSQSFEVTLSNIFQMQTDIAEQVARALAVALSPDDRQTIEARSTENAEAYDYYLRGLQESYLPSMADVRESMTLFRKATELDPRFSDAWVQSCKLYAFGVFNGEPPDSLLPLSKRSLDKVKELSPNSFQADLAEGYYWYYGFRNYDEAMRFFSLALKLQPNNETIIAAIAFVKRRQGKFQESHDLLARTCDLDPQAWRNWFELGYLDMIMRQYPSADEHMRRSLLLLGRGSTPVASYHAVVVLAMTGDLNKAHEIFVSEADDTNSWTYRMRSSQFHVATGNLEAARNDLDRRVLGEPDIDSVSWYLASAYLHGRLTGQRESRAYYDSARVLAERSVRRSPNESRWHENLGITLAHLNQKTRAIEEGKKAVELMPLEKDALDDGPNALSALAAIYALTGESDAAIDILEQLLGMPGFYTIYIFQNEPDFASLKTSPRFQQLIEKYKTAR